MDIHSRPILVDVDTQVDFMCATGALYVPGAEAITANLAALAQAARAAAVPHLSTLDTHTPDDPEFAAYGFPPHCVDGTAGWMKIPATRPVEGRLVACRSSDATRASASDVARGGASDGTSGGSGAGSGTGASEAVCDGTRELAFTKATFDVFTNPAFAPAVAALAPSAAIVMGVATDYCVKAAVMGLRRLGVPVLLVEDAIAAVAPETGAAALAEMQAAGATLLSTAAAVALLEGRKEAAHVA